MCFLFEYAAFAKFPRSVVNCPNILKTSVTMGLTNFSGEMSSSSAYTNLHVVCNVSKCLSEPVCDNCIQR